MFKKKNLMVLAVAFSVIFMFACSDSGNGGKSGNSNYSQIVLIEVDFGRETVGMAKIKYNKDFTANDLLPFYNDFGDDFDWDIFDDHEPLISDINNSGLKNYYKNMKILGGVVVRDNSNDPFLRAYRNDTLFFIDALFDGLQEGNLSESDRIKIMQDLGLVLPKEENLTMDLIVYEIDGSYYSYVSSEMILNETSGIYDDWEVVLQKTEYTKSFDDILFDEDKILTQNPVTYVVNIDRTLYPNVNFILQD